jgi:tungstate transport system permease protein
LLEEYHEQLRSLGASSGSVVQTLLWDGRYRLTTAVLAGVGRSIAEVGAVMIVGGNIDHVTRTMTTAIALETSKGNLALAVTLGIILLVMALVINVALLWTRKASFAHAQ